MGHTELFTPVLEPAAYHAAPAVAADPDSDRRWAAWVARGRAHDERVGHRLRLMVMASMLTIGAAVAYRFLAS